MTQVKSHEPLLRIAKRDSIARPKAWAIRIVAVLLSLVVSGVFIFAVTKLNPSRCTRASLTAPSAPPGAAGLLSGTP